MDDRVGTIIQGPYVRDHSVNKKSSYAQMHPNINSRIKNFNPWISIITKWYITVGRERLA
jgi:hypothetical protein